jgi:hypothetical protein
MVPEDEKGILCAKQDADNGKLPGPETIYSQVLKGLVLMQP